jgi:TonB family protein
VMQANLVKQVTPVYPAIAKTAHISGTVVLHALIGTDGKIADLQYVSGPPLLMKAAMDAVREWEYKPVLLNGEAVRADTTITVVFTLGDNSKPAPDESSSSAPAASSDSEASHPAAVVDGQYRADAVQLLDLVHYRQSASGAMRQMTATLRPQMLAAFPMTPNHDKIVDEYLDRLVDMANTPEFTELIIQVYAKYLSDYDLKELVQFYQTPAGQHYADVQPKLAVDAAAAGQKMGAERGVKILGELCKEYPELQGEAKFCPADTKKTSHLDNSEGLTTIGQ